MSEIDKYQDIKYVAVFVTECDKNHSYNKGIDWENDYSYEPFFDYRLIEAKNDQEAINNFNASYNTEMFEGWERSINGDNTDFWVTIRFIGLEKHEITTNISLLIEN